MEGFSLSDYLFGGLALVMSFLSWYGQRQIGRIDALEDKLSNTVKREDFDTTRREYREDLDRIHRDITRAVDTMSEQFNRKRLDDHATIQQINQQLNTITQALIKGNNTT